MKSHKQLPKFIIKNFQNKSGKVYYYDIKNELIGEAGPKVLGTEEGYFSNIIENLLNTKVESPFSSFLANTKKNPFSTSELSEEKDKIVRAYISCTFFRSNYAREMFYQESFIAQFYPPQFINDFLVWATLSKEGYTLSCFRNHQTNIVVNESEKAFITSRDGYSFIQSNGIECILIPFDPYIALLLAPLEYEKKHEIITLPCDADVMYINEQILSNENEYNSDFIISTDKEELERLRDYLANKK